MEAVANYHHHSIQAGFGALSCNTISLRGAVIGSQTGDSVSCAVCPNSQTEPATGDGLESPDRDAATHEMCSYETFESWWRDVLPIRAMWLMGERIRTGARHLGLIRRSGLGRGSDAAHQRFFPHHRPHGKASRESFREPARLPQNNVFRSVASGQGMPVVDASLVRD